MGTIRKNWTDEQDQFLFDYYQQRGLMYCAEALDRNVNSIMHRVQRLGIKKRGKMKPPIVTLSEEGYLSLKGNGKHYFIHRIIAEYLIGRTLLDDEVVHHKDGDKLNNHPDNLQVMTRSDHMKLHSAERWKKAKAENLRKI